MFSKCQIALGVCSGQWERGCGKVLSEGTRSLEKYQDVIFLLHHVDIFINGGKSNGGQAIAGNLAEIKAVEPNCCTSRHMLSSATYL